MVDVPALVLAALDRIPPLPLVTVVDRDHVVQRAGDPQPVVEVQDLMHVGEALPLVAAHTQMSDALIEISQKGFGVVGVTDDKGALRGIITDGDLRRHMEGLLDHKADEVMTQSPTTIDSEALAEQAVGIMNARKITCLFVTNGDGTDKPLGLLHIHDCLRVGLG